MKPKDLKAAFQWENRLPLLADRVFHVPQYYFEHHRFPFPGWEGPLLFGNQNPVCIEYCSGNGAWIFQRAKQSPYLNWVAVEKRFDRVQKIWSKIKNENLSNLFVVCAEAWTFTHHYMPTASVEEIFINFPDPWPKKRHVKHRLMKPLFFDEVARVLKTGKKVTFVSDDFDYLSEVMDLFQKHRFFEPLFPKPYFVTQFNNYESSWFEKLWREKRRTICYTQWSLK